MHLLNEGQIAEMLRKNSREINELESDSIMPLESRKHLLELELKKIALRASKIYQFWLKVRFFLLENWEGFQFACTTTQECVIILTNGLFHAGFCNSYCDKQAVQRIIQHPEKYLRNWTAEFIRRDEMLFIKIQEDINVPPFGEGKSLHIQLEHDPFEYLKRWVLYQNQFPDDYAISIPLQILHQQDEK
jgi:hypothetical protein